MGVSGQQTLVGDLSVSGIITATSGFSVGIQSGGEVINAGAAIPRLTLLVLVILSSITLLLRVLMLLLLVVVEAVLVLPLSMQMVKVHRSHLLMHIRLLMLI